MGLHEKLFSRTGPGVDIHNLPDTPPDVTLNWKRKYKKYSEGTSNPPPSPAKKSKKYGTSRRILRFADIETAEVHKTVATKTASTAEVSRASEAAKVTKVTEITKESSHPTKEAEKEFAEASTRQNPSLLMLRTPIFPTL